jgi:hypothetical protein
MITERLTFEGAETGSGMRRSGVGTMKTVVRPGKAGTGAVRRNIPGIKRFSSTPFTGKQGAGDITWK